ncbi:MAG: TIGR03364 family FAD-dependent oxidoreductase [Betaproteobacteria bacterium]|nr:TIGR03364 family FAD-dependent oxidoreductase [Betaproteobacteria bacterium]
MSGAYDVVIAGAGIVGLAHALAAVKRGLSVAVIERDAYCVGASIRNFGFITVTGQSEGDTWRRARLSRDIWLEVAQEARIPIVHRGLWVLAKRPSAAQVLQAFMRTPMAEGNALVDADEAGHRAPWLRTEGANAALWSPHELRVESRLAIPQLTQWLAERHGVVFRFGETVLEAGHRRVRTNAGTLTAGRTVICTGADLTGVAARSLAQHALDLTRLQMLRVRTAAPLTLDSAVMSDLSLVRYGGYAALSESAALLADLRAEEQASLDAGIHLIAVQSADGSLVVGDSHHRGAAADPFSSEPVDALILRHLREAVRMDGLSIESRWMGVYPVGAQQDCVIEAPEDDTRTVVVTSGTGASTAFAIAEEVFNEW